MLLGDDGGGHGALRLEHKPAAPAADVVRRELKSAIAPGRHFRVCVTTIVSESVVALWLPAVATAGRIHCPATSRSTATTRALLRCVTVPAPT